MNLICHNDGHFNIYSTISDTFMFASSLTKDQLEFYIRKQYGKEGLNELPSRILRAEQTGTSAIGKDEDLESTLLCNIAGKNETHLTIEQCVEIFLS